MCRLQPRERAISSFGQLYGNLCLDLQWGLNVKMLERCLGVASIDTISDSATGLTFAVVGPFASSTSSGC
jgi:hypothetical protein